MIVNKDFGGAEVAFEPSLINGSIMVNATQMVKAFPNKRINDFLNNQITKDFIAECLNNGNSRYLGIESEIDLINSRQNKGTWMHRILALKFAAWLSPAFELWVYSTIDEILFGYSREYDKSIEQAVILTYELKALKKKTDKDSKDFDRYLMLTDQLTAEKTHRASLTRSRFSEIYRDIKPLLKTN